MSLEAQSLTTNTSATVAVVTVTYNSGKVIDGFLRSLLTQDHADFILFVVDNASSDDTLTQIGQFHDLRIKVIANQDNRGIAEANNQGIVAGLSAGCEYILLINNDTEFGPGLIDSLLRGIDLHEADMAAPKIFFYDPPDVIWSAGGGLDKRRAYSGFHIGYGEKDHGQFDTPRYIDHAPACCLLIRKHVFERIGLMDKNYFTYVEDTDFCFRAKCAGMRLAYLPEAALRHKAHSLTGGMFSEFMMRYTTRNRVYFILKHLGFWRALYYIPGYQLHLLLQLLSRNIAPNYSHRSMFWLRQRAFFEGLSLWLHSNEVRARL